MFLGGCRAGAPIAGVVGVGSIDDHRQIELGRQRFDLLVELDLAEITAIGWIGRVMGVVEFAGGQHFVADADFAPTGGPLPTRLPQGWRLHL